MGARGTEGEEGCDGGDAATVSEGKKGAAVSKEVVRSSKAEGDGGRGEGRSGEISGIDYKSYKGRGLLTKRVTEKNTALGFRIKFMGRLDNGGIG
ncbi:hypothetical protein L3X38_015841 [Prunus dulcis]|uniref:Uncharacterized protein n=1 Tax=Prunus dulcis TaxID=3755 RepID=A0AAD4W4A1_PRUDU|nr:hypothetical protein L3X38_015841 [Prunus dulcis]